jgi:hypothetical protein
LSSQIKAVDSALGAHAGVLIGLHTPAVICLVSRHLVYRYMLGET